MIIHSNQNLKIKIIIIIIIIIINKHKKIFLLNHLNNLNLINIKKINHLNHNNHKIKIKPFINKNKQVGKIPIQKSLEIHVNSRYNNHLHCSHQLVVDLLLMKQNKLKFN